MVLTIDQPQLTASLSRMCTNDATTTDGTQNGGRSSDGSRYSSVQKSWCTHLKLWNLVFHRLRIHAERAQRHGGAGDGIGLRFGGIGRELQNIECSSHTSCGHHRNNNSYWNSFCILRPSGIYGSGSTTGDRSNVSRQTAEGQCEQGSSDLARYDAEDLNNTGVLQSVRVWTDKIDDNGDTWEGRNSTLQQSQCVILFSDGN